MMLRRTAGFIVFFLFLGWALYYFFTPQLIDLALSAMRMQAGLEKKSVTIDEHRLSYLEGGEGETIILLHGFAANKDTWLLLARELTPSYHVIIPDLPGFGESSQHWGESYDIKNQSRRLDKFTRALELEHYHLAGNSMGGYLAQIYAGENPHRIKSIALWSPFGLQTQMDRLLNDYTINENPLLIASGEEFQDLLPIIFANPPRLPSRVEQALVREAIANRTFHQKILTDTKRYFLPAEDKIPSIDAPVLLVWGRDDRLLPLDQLDLYRKEYAGQDPVIQVLEDCGHIPMLEKREESAAIYYHFLQQQLPLLLQNRE